MKCPCCEEQLMWQSDFMCDEVFGCECSQGVVSLYECSNCDAKLEITKGCKGNE